MATAIRGARRARVSGSVCGFARESESEGDKGRRGGARRGGPPSPRDDSAVGADERVEGDRFRRWRGVATATRKTTGTLLLVPPWTFLFPFNSSPFPFSFSVL